MVNTTGPNSIVDIYEEGDRLRCVVKSTQAQSTRDPPEPKDPPAKEGVEAGEGLPGDSKEERGRFNTSWYRTIRTFTGYAHCNDWSHLFTLAFQGDADPTALIGKAVRCLKKLKERKLPYLSWLFILEATDSPHIHGYLNGLAADMLKPYLASEADLPPYIRKRAQERQETYSIEPLEKLGYITVMPIHSTEERNRWCSYCIKEVEKTAQAVTPGMRLLRYGGKLDKPRRVLSGQGADAVHGWLEAQAVEQSYPHRTPAMKTVNRGALGYTHFIDNTAENREKLRKMIT